MENDVVTDVVDGDIVLDVVTNCLPCCKAEVVALLSGQGEELCKTSNIWRIYFIGLEMILLRCHRGVVIFIYLECLVVVLAVGIIT